MDTSTTTQYLQIFRDWLRPHRVVLLALLVIALGFVVYLGEWDWLPRYLPRIFSGIGITISMLAGSVFIGFLLAVPLGIVQVTGPWWLKAPATIFCTVFRGTPLLLQLWLLYYGLGSLFPMIPGIRSSFLWPYLREAWPYGLFALTMSFAAYEGEVMRGAFAGVPSGELQAGRAFGMGRFKVFHRIWFPRAFYRALPTLVGETVLHLKATPLVATITVIDIYGVITKVRQDTLLTYEPLFLLAAIYLVLTCILVLAMGQVERQIPVKGV